MPRIDPQQLLRCLSVLLSPDGGIKSKDEVQRLASLMTKFSKKLVSKCIYVSILKATGTDLLIMFMSAGGWDLTYSWLNDGVAAKNWPLVTEMVELLLICPVDIDRLKTNACPKLIKTLSKDNTADERVRLLACKLVEQWLRIVRGDSDPSTSKSVDQDPSLAVASSISVPDCKDPCSQNEKYSQENDQSGSASDSDVKSESAEVPNENHLPVYKITIRDGKKVLAEISGDRRSSTDAPDEEESTGTEDVNQEDYEPSINEIEDEDDDDEDLIRPVKVNKKAQSSKAKKPAKVYNTNKKERDSTDSSSSSGKSPNRKDITKPGSKKSKSESAKIKPTGKNKTSPKSKDGRPDLSLSKESDVAHPSKSKERLSLSLKNKKGANKSITEKERFEHKFEKITGKEKKIDDVESSLTEKEKESLSKFITPPISKVGKIPKKTANKEEKMSEEKNRTLKDENTDLRKGIEVKKSDIKRPEKKISMSVEPKRTFENDSRPKTVKTYNSKFRSTGLEEEIKPPPPPQRIVPKKTHPPLPSALVLSDKKVIKRNSPPPSELVVPEKKAKSELDDKKPTEKAGGIKLIPPKPKPMFLQESDVFMDAMLAANTMKEPRKRKRRMSNSKEPGVSDPKKDNSPNNSPKHEETSPSCIKPTFKFYQDTLDTSTEEDKDVKMENDEMYGNAEDDQKSMSSEDEKTTIKTEGGNGGLKGVLMHLKSRRQKKSVTWKENGLESIKYFDLDETERVNVTKNFADMKSMEREHERENFQIARKLAVDDVMEEKMGWKVLIPVDNAAPVVAPGKNSQEKEIQYAREKTVAAAHYFNKRSIPDSPEEPDLEIHATTDPTIIPLDDITGSTDSINDFTNTPWPEPRVAPPAPVPINTTPPPQAQQQQPPFPLIPGPFPQPGPTFQPMGPFMPGMPMAPAGDMWRGADGKVMPMQPDMFPPQGMMPPPGMPGMPPGPMMMGPGPDMPFPMGPMGPTGPNPSPEEMAHFGGGFPPMGPPQMYGGPPGPPGPPGPLPPQGNNFPNSGGGNWQGSGGGGNWYNEDQAPPHHNQGGGGGGGGGGSGRYQGGGGSNWRGGRGGNRNRKYSDGWSGSNSRTPICNNFLKRGFCRNNSCRFRHPR